MIRKQNHHAAKVFAVVASVAFILQIHAQRNDSEAKSWLKSNSERREAYVAGYVEGYYRGYVLGCEAIANDLPRPVQPASIENFPVNKCIDKKLDLTKGIDLTNDVTTFYRRYPENRNLYVKEILEELGKGKSLEQIHNHPPFPPISSKSRVPVK